MNPSFRGPLWFGIALLAVIAAVGAWLYFLKPVEKSLDVSVALTANPANVFIGDPFDLSLVITNNATTALSSATIELILPQNVVSAETPTERVITQPIGMIDPAALSHQDFKLVATNGANSIANVVAKILYNSAGSSAQFENDGSLNIPIGEQAVSLNISAPANVFSGQNFPVAIAYANNTTDTLQNFSIALQPPPAFTFSGPSSWDLGAIPVNGTGTIIVNGNLVGPNQASYPIGVLLNDSIGGQDYVVANPSTNVSLATSPLSFSISLNGSQNYVAKPSDNLNYTLSFTNNSSVAFQNVIISATLQGQMFDFSSIQTDGSFNSLKNMITWNGATEPNLLSLAPGQSGSVSFTIHTKTAFPIRLPSDKNYSVSVEGRIVSPTVPPGTAASSTISVADIVTNFGGNIVLGEDAYHKDSSLPIKISATPTASSSVAIAANTGPYPPRVNKPTQYTIHWLLTNYATDAQNVTISAYLQSGTTCTGGVFVPASTTFSCNSTSGQVTWSVPVVAATTGITDKPLEAIFQVANTPAVNQVGQDITLLGPASLTATDPFTSSTLQSSVPAVTTQLPNDMSVPAYPRSVTQ